MRSRPIKPSCQSFVPWLEHHVGKGCLAPCTGQDAAALKAFAHLLDVYAYGDAQGREAAVRAMAALVELGMQASIRPLAKRMIPHAHALDWPDEDRIWAQIEALCGAAVERQDPRDRAVLKKAVAHGSIL